MRVIRSAGQNVSPSDDGRLFDQIFSDGLFTETSITNLGGNNISIGAMYGDLCGRDFTTEAQTLAVVLPEGEGESTGYIYVEIDTSSEDVISVNSALAPFTPTYEDINTNGAVAQMIIAEYTATNLNVTSVTATYSTAGAGGVEPGSIATIERSPATANHSIGEFIVYNSKLYKVIAAIVTGETLVEGTNIESASVGSELTSLNNSLTNKDFLQEQVIGYLGTVPLYRTVLQIGTVVNGTTYDVSALNIGNVVSMYGSGYNSGDSGYFPIPYYDTSVNRIVPIYTPSLGKIGFWAGETYSNVSLTLEYTKAS